MKALSVSVALCVCVTYICVCVNICICICTYTYMYIYLDICISVKLISFVSVYFMYLENIILKRSTETSKWVHDTIKVKNPWSRGNKIVIFMYLKSYQMEEELDLFSLVSEDRTKYNRWKLQRGRFYSFYYMR